MNDDKLKCCPFCGNAANFEEGHEHSYIGGYDITIYVKCSMCPAEMSTSYGVYGKEETKKEDAQNYLADQWNYRI